MFAFGFAVHAWSIAMRKREEEYPRAMRPAEESAVPAVFPMTVTLGQIGVFLEGDAGQTLFSVFRLRNATKRLGSGTVLTLFRGDFRCD